LVLHIGAHIDYDILLSGAEVSDLALVFETYWKSPSSVSGAAFDESVSDNDLAAVRALVAEELEKGTQILATVLAEEGAWEHRVGSISIPLNEDTFSVVADTPEISKDAQPTQVIESLRTVVDSAQRDMVVVTPFFVPNENDVEWYQRMVDRGVRVRILTNSLASNQGTISNSGLNKQRFDVVKAGVELHELRTDAADKARWETPPQVARYLGLHAKFYAIDRERVFLGSVNLDPRSKFVNTEMGVLIENTQLAEVTADAITRLMTPDNAWRVEIGTDGRLQWRSDTEIVRRQPARGTVNASPTRFTVCCRFGTTYDPFGRGLGDVRGPHLRPAVRLEEGDESEVDQRRQKVEQQTEAWRPACGQRR